MPHEIGKQRNIVVFIKKVFSETVPERVRINHLGVDAVFCSIVFELLRNPARRNSFAKAV